MTELDELFGPLALELIDEFGKEITYFVTNASNYNVETGKAVKAEGPGVTIRAVVEDVDGSKSKDMVEGASKKLTIASQALDNAPANFDYVELPDRLTVLKVKATYSGDEIAIYECWVGS